MEPQVTPILHHETGLPVLQNRLFATAEEARHCETGEIMLIQDRGTGIVHNAAFDGSRVVYDKDYNNEQSASVVFKNHMHDVRKVVERTMGRDALVEVGCGKGGFLEELRRDAFDIIGYDPAYEGCSPWIERRVFDASKSSRAKGLILRHVLEHIQNPVGFLSQLAQSNRHEGLIYIEVPCLDWICGTGAWSDIFYEHVNYFRLSDFGRIFSRIIESGHFFGDQYLYVVADLASLRCQPAASPSVGRFPQTFRAPVRLDSRYAAHAVWGAGSKGVIFSIFAERDGGHIDLAVDINESKQGRYMPVTGCRVESPSASLELLPARSCIHVMNPNYVDEVTAIVGGRHHVTCLGDKSRR